jgi:hypothetical protein
MDNSLNKIFKKSQDEPFVVSISHSLNSKKFAYKFQKNSINNIENSKFIIWNCSVFIYDLSQKNPIENRFNILFTSEKRAVIICDELHGEFVPELTITIPLKYSKINNVWIGQSTYKNISSIFTRSSFGILSDMFCYKMQIIFSDKKGIEFQCLGFNDFCLNKSKSEDYEDRYDKYIIVEKEEKKLCA